MASLEQIIRTNENAYRVPEKMQKSKGARKPLGDMTNSSKPLGKDKSLNGFKVQQKVLTSTKAGRKPLGDLSNSNKPQLNEKSSKKPQLNEKSSKKYCTENLSAVRENLEVENWGFGEGFLHDHKKCIEAQRQAMSISMDYFLETVGLKTDSFSPESPKLSTDTKWEFEIGKLEMMDEFPLTPPRESMTPPTPKSHKSPCWEMDWLGECELRLKESPQPRN